MKKIKLALLGLGLASLGGVAQAGTVNGDMTITGTAANACVWSAPAFSHSQTVNAIVPLTLSQDVSITCDTGLAYSVRANAAAPHTTAGTSVIGFPNHASAAAGTPNANQYMAALNSATQTTANNSGLLFNNGIAQTGTGALQTITIHYGQPSGAGSQEVEFLNAGTFSQTYTIDAVF